MDLRFFLRWIDHMVFMANRVQLGLRWHLIHWVGVISLWHTLKWVIHMWGRERYALLQRGIACTCMAQFSLFFRQHPPYFPCLLELASLWVVILTRVRLPTFRSPHTLRKRNHTRRCYCCCCTLPISLISLESPLHVVFSPSKSQWTQ